MKAYETLAVAAILAGSVSACSAEETAFGCGAYLNSNTGVSVEAVAKAIRLCYDSAPAERRSVSEGGKVIDVKILTRSGGAVYFSAYSDAPSGSTPDEYASKSPIIFSSVFAPGSTTIQADSTVVRQPSGDLFARWEGTLQPGGLPGQSLCWNSAAA